MFQSSSKPYFILSEATLTHSISIPNWLKKTLPKAWALILTARLRWVAGPNILWRYRLFLTKEKRFSEAIQDIDLALLYDPENLSYISLLNSIQNYVNEMSDEIEKRHISSLVSDVKNRLQAKPPTESESDEEDDEALLNFSKLKQIDRKSVRIFGKLENRKSVI